MKLHEYQAKEMLAKEGVAVPPGFAATTVADAVSAAEKLGGNFWVVKAQVHAGGRGKGRFREITPEADLHTVLAGGKVPGFGGVALCKSMDEVESAAKAMLGNTLVTKQTGIDGVQVNTIYITTGADISREIYAAVLLDRQNSQVVLMCSSEGGTEIEEVAEENPDAIHKIWVDPATGLGGWQAREMAFKLGLNTAKNTLRGAIKMFQGLYEVFMKYDASMVEINPLIVDGEGEVIALDAKITIDTNASFRHKALFAEEDQGEKDPYEAKAEEYNLNFIKLDGDIGCMVNGAGLAMATMDIIKYYGSEPANFLDVGGGAKTSQVKAALEIISTDPNVKAILINIFGGIMKCDVIAEGVIAAVKEVGLELPLIVRLAGTNVDLGKKMLAESGLAIIPAEDLADAAKKAVEATKA
jgi:succinyl-CoA synthetase beta subunit